MTKRFQFVVEIDQDMFPGTMHTQESALSAIERALDDRLGHYQPAVAFLKEVERPSILMNDCSVCGEPMLGAHYHEPPEGMTEKYWTPWGKYDSKISAFMDGHPEWADDFTGSTEWDVFVYRFGRRLLSTDDRGFVDSRRYATEEEAEEKFAAIENAYNKWCDQDEGCEICGEPLDERAGGAAEMVFAQIADADSMVVHAECGLAAGMVVA